MSKDRVVVRLQYEVLPNGVIALTEDVLTKHGIASAFVAHDGSWCIMIEQFGTSSSPATYEGRAINIRGAKAAIRRKLVSLGADLGIEVKS